MTYVRLLSNKVNDQSVRYETWLRIMEKTCNTELILIYLTLSKILAPVNTAVNTSVSTGQQIRKGGNFILPGSPLPGKDAG